MEYSGSRTLLALGTEAIGIVSGAYAGAKMVGETVASGDISFLINFAPPYCNGYTILLNKADLERKDNVMERFSGFLLMLVLCALAVISYRSKHIIVSFICFFLLSAFVFTAFYIRKSKSNRCY